ncbi:putative metalloprotease [Serinicoccus hydrothermalis]|uniref:Neutral metalloproteinase n=1 Tax=Serinicoccus hydrothermalis TaxID=1758689 RepID=A0A1B1NGY7_9MICO|nr:M4 family metallopeptidase [Serinicoccus hydrothermalis]ANS80661.1 putative metalloprotease [Serinicoccus hydrothermalis]
MTGTRCTIIPGYLLARIAEAEPELAPAVQFTLQDALHTRGRREVVATRWPGGQPPGQGGFLPPTMPLHREPAAPEQAGPPRTVVPEGAAPRRSVYDADGATTLPGRLVRGEGDPATEDVAVTEAYDGLGATWELLARSYGRDSLDGNGLVLVATVHYGQDYDNAFWDGRQMVFGDGDGVYFTRFTASLDVIAHELGHGLVQYTSGLTYVGQPGALNESVCDVIGSLVRQRVLGHDAGSADWLIGADLLTDRVQGVALRSMAAPGTAYDDPALGADPQPAHMDDYVDLPHDADNDNGGVHINSGIPNKAFHLFATELGGPAWERAGQVWFDTLATRGRIARDVDFATFAAATLVSARERYADAPEVVEALLGAWDGVGIAVS